MNWETGSRCDHLRGTLPLADIAIRIPMELPFATSIYRLFYAGWLFSFGTACTQVPAARGAKARPKCVRGKGRGASPPQTPTMTAGSSALQAGIVRDARRSARLKKTLAANALLSLAIFASLASCAATAYPDLNRQPMPPDCGELRTARHRYAACIGRNRGASGRAHPGDG